MSGWHWKVHREGPVVNIPYWPHRIIVIGLGRVSRAGAWHPWQACCYRMRL